VDPVRTPGDAVHALLCGQPFGGRVIYDAIVIGGGPAGSTTALLLAQAGWAVALVEKSQFPRPKVCGEFISASSFPLFAELGLLEDVRRLAGPEIRRVGIFSGETVSISGMPPVSSRFGNWGMALGREHLDLLMLEAAVRAGANLWQPFRVAHIEPFNQGWRCEISHGNNSTSLFAKIIVAANGSWERSPWLPDCAAPHKASDLLAFKAHFEGADLASDLMPLLVFPGGYGGMVRSDAGRVSLYCCISRRTLDQCRKSDERAGDAVLRHLRHACRGVADALKHTKLHGAWLSAGPIRPGIRVTFANGMFRVGNAAGEAHPIIAEGISMAVQSAWLLCRSLISEQNALDNASILADVGRAYAASWRVQFASRVHAAAVFAHTLKRPQSAALALALPKRFPALLSFCAALSGKTKQIPIGPPG
jgi:flavin-dependent dehydrogenase